MSNLDYKISDNKTLIIIPSQTRAADLTYEKLKKYIINPNKADMGCFISEECCLTEMEKDSKYVFKLPEYENHVDGLYKELEYFSKDSICKIKKTDLTTYQKSTFIHVYYRLFILRMLKQHNLIEKYDWFIINRSDLMHCKEIKTEILDKDFVYLPNGEHYYGLPDRFAIIPKIYIEKWLSIYDEKYFIDYKKIIGISQNKPNIYGPEKMTKANQELRNIPLEWIHYSFFCVAKKTTLPTNTFYDFYNKELGIIIKYKSEYRKCLKLNRQKITWV